MGWFIFSVSSVFLNTLYPTILFLLLVLFQAEEMFIELRAM